MGADLSENKPNRTLSYGEINYAYGNEKETSVRVRFKEEPKSPKIADQDVSCLKKGMYWLCGIESMINSSDEPAKIESKQHEMDTSISQDPFWAKVCDINAVLAIALSAFCIGFFNRYN